MWRLIVRLWRCWEWACIAAIEQWFDTFARAWHTGDGRPQRQVAAAPSLAPRAQEKTEARVTPPADQSTRRGAVGLATPVVERVNGATLAQPRMDEAAIVGGLMKLGARKEQALKAASVALRSGERDASGLMRRALAALTEK